MTKQEAKTWLEEHRAELEMIMATSRILRRHIPGCGFAEVALLPTINIWQSVHDGSDALKMFAEWSAGVDP